MPQRERAAPAALEADLSTRARTEAPVVPAPRPPSPSVVETPSVVESPSVVEPPPPATAAPTAETAVFAPVEDLPELDEPREPTAWDGPIVSAARNAPTAAAVVETGSEVDTESAAGAEFEPLLTPPSASWNRLGAILAIVGLVAAGIAGAQVAETEGWIDSVANPVVRAAALVSTWCAIVLLSRRCGGRTIVIGVFTAVALALAGAFPEQWALAGAAVTAGSVYGLLAMVYTRPARGLWLARELLVSAVIGLVGALVVSGYHVELRPYRFRMMVLGLVLVGAFSLAWRLGHGARSIGRRGGAIIIVGVVVLAGSLAYVQAVRTWGSPALVQNLDDFKAWVAGLLGAAPRPVEALVGFPALIWGVAARRRRRQGWWMCAFGALGAGGVTSSLIYPGVSFSTAMASTGYDVAIGLVIGVIVVVIDRILTGGGGRRADATRDANLDRPEPARFAPLL